jgi:hypothetical protein
VKKPPQPKAWGLFLKRKNMKHRIANLFGKHSSKIWRAFLTSVPARLWGFITIPLVGMASGAYEVSTFWALAKAVAMYSALGFAWALFVEFNWLHVKQFFGSKNEIRRGKKPN